MGQGIYFWDGILYSVIPFNDSGKVVLTMMVKSYITACIKIVQR
jgi:hypothetical protein